jgi:hypothetical protein
MTCYIAVVQLTEDANLDNQQITLLMMRKQRALAVFSSRRLCEDFIEEHPVEVDGLRAIPWEVDRATLTDMVELLYAAGIGFVVFNPAMVSDTQWSTGLTPMHLGTYLVLLKEMLPVPEVITTENAANIADRRSAYPDDLPIATKSSIARLKSVLDDIRAKIEEWEI